MSEKLIDHCLKTGASRAKIIPTSEIAALNRVECGECPEYGRNLSCPPLIPPPHHFFNGLPVYKQGLLLQLDGPGISHPENIFSYSSKLHTIVLELETHLWETGYQKVKGLISGCCKLCRCCPPPGKPCRFPDRARSSMEAVGINVVSTCEKAGMPLVFPVGETARWTGLLLF
ncbi:MAG: DUF2284 domain-containing protein [Bacillota bacterium]